MSKGTDVMMAGIHESYAARPKSIEDTCLASFGTNYALSEEEAVMTENFDTCRNRQMRTH